MIRSGVLAATLVVVFAGFSAQAAAAVDYTATDYNTASGPFDPELANLDGKNGPDLVYADSASSVQYMLNDGTGHFGSPVTLNLQYPSTTDQGVCRFGAVPQVELGSVNADSFVDIVTGCEQTFRGKGDGTFLPPIFGGAFSRGLVEFDLAKIDGTVTPDIATACGSQSGNQDLAYQSASGDGTFGPVKCIQDPNDLSFTPISKEVEVFNVGNDAYTELASLDAGGDHLLVFQFDPAANPVSLYGPVPSARALSSTNGQAVETGDLDDDNDPDVVVAMKGPPAKLSVLEHKSNGFPLGETGELNPGLNNVTQLSLADVDGDGSPDAVSANASGAVGVQIGNGDTTFEDVQQFSASGSPDGLATADLNVDGKADIVTTSSTGVATVLLSKASTDTKAPVTTIGKIKVKKHTAKVSFSAHDAVDPASALDFGCKIDSKQSTQCHSPKTYRNLKPGRHTVRVRAQDSAGNVGAYDKKGFKIEK